MTNTSFRTLAGTIQGWQDGAVIRATGIPYAIAERYEKPREIIGLGSIEPYMATNWSPACPQSFSPVLKEVFGMDMMDELPLNENCQHLSITIPASTPVSAGLPVMVWIHGGSYLTGAGDMTAYDPALLVSEQQVVVVNVTYRLGLFGFLGGYNDIPANLGLLDIIAALRWIKRHIDAFGGNPENITLFGQSAGGDAIAHLMLAEGVENLFHRVIIQSAPLGIRKGKASLTETLIKKVAAFPKNSPVNKLLDIQNTMLFSMKRVGLKGGMPFGVQYGFEPLPHEERTEEVWRKRANQWDILIGWTNRETALFAPYIKLVQHLSYVPVFGKAMLEWLIRKTTDSVYRTSGRAFAELMASGHRQVYEYQIDWGEKKNNFRGAHVIDIPLLFGNEQLWKNALFCKGSSPEELRLAGRRLRTVWANFARTGVLEEKKTIPGLISYKRVNV
ncbi:MULTISPECIES: carboxylesterase family protein [Olivibacter]|jgi:para-nitrobenzyl esterase|uniref:Carboxylic ester hydrolase n=2 Tax=Olivibacter TaxID=376469 RepID=A0ABV6HMJ4_9SPHI|nr:MULTISPECIES: carboxylesterase family protein [Olivibacter]MCL4640181.1 carboxylesterase family protein [Olivibacter sp. UJ_SKK_5.1]MDM8173046.1 carboxylesterase family protein [Olivibacter sp. 47]MDX3915525.1 carboxylesterase family protein [Pseudosphingobacterium sp.]QEL02833.1 carboxylesterase family protein [Olivibacter sp. LS-1]